MNNFKPVYTILFKGCPLLVTPIGETLNTTFLVDLEDSFMLIEKQLDPDGVTFWTEFGKGLTSLSNGIGNAIEEKNRNISTMG